MEKKNKLSKQELYDLIDEYQLNHNISCKEKILLANTKLVYSLMKRFYQKEQYYDDLFQVGMIGLIKAIDNFNTSYQLQFSTYAVPLILGEMKQYLRDNSQVRISRTIKDLAYNILKEKDNFLLKYQRVPTIDELGVILAVDRNKIVEAMQSIVSVASLQEIIKDDVSLSEMISLDNDNVKHYHQHLDLKQAMKCLNNREKKIIEERYYQGYSQCEIANELVISQAQVSRIEKNALEKLHKQMT